MRVPRSILLGRPTPKPGERLWLEDDLDAALAYERWLAERCPRCGTFESEWLDPTTHRRVEFDPYEPEPHQCPGCASLEQFEAAMRGPKGDTGPPGMRTRLRRVLEPGEIIYPGVFSAVPAAAVDDDDRPPVDWLNPLRFRL